MRKITDKSIDCFLHGTPFRSKNTNVNINGDQIQLELFGNKIAWVDSSGTYISNCGWFTNTTKERLNGIPGVTIVQKSGDWYLNGEMWDGRATKIY